MDRRHIGGKEKVLSFGFSVTRLPQHDIEAMDNAVLFRRVEGRRKGDKGRRKGDWRWERGSGVMTGDEGK
jgi:hypothetical protein